MSVIESIRIFIRDNCPLLQEFDQMFPPTVGMEKLEENTGAYTVQLVPSEPIVKRYVNGDTIRRVSFYFASREAYEAVENIDTSEFYEAFSEWLETCTRKRNLPELSEGKDAKCIKATTHGYLMDVTEAKARYQIQCEFQYYQSKGEETWQ